MNHVAVVIRVDRLRFHWPFFGAIDNETCRTACAIATCQFAGEASLAELLGGLKGPITTTFLQ
jgi:hypothetical protein